MKKYLATITSSLVLAVGLTVPAWAQLGRVGAGAGAGIKDQGNASLGHSDLSTSSTDRLGVNANQQGLKASTTDSAKTQVKAKDKVKTKANLKANAQAGASARVKAKKQKGHKNNQQDVSVKSDTSAKVDANAQAQASVH